MNYKDAGVARTRWNQIRRKKITGSAATTAPKTKAGGKKAAVKKGKKAASESDSDGETEVKAEAEDNDEEDEVEEQTKPAPKKRGRPAKKPVTKAESEDEDEETKPLTKKRGRPAKKAAAKTDSDNEADKNDADMEVATNDDANKDEEAEAEAEAEVEDLKPALKKRGRPAKATARKKAGAKGPANKIGRKVATTAASEDEDEDPAPLAKKIKTENAEEENAALGGADEENGVKAEPAAEESEV
jgi:hypothetical protein